MLPICLLNMFLILMTVYEQGDSDYLSNAITLGLTMAFFFETRAASTMVGGGDDDDEGEDEDGGDDDDDHDDDDDDA
jgi:hypothetical protein